MQFHHQGYVVGDPSLLPAAGVGVDRADDLPDSVDVLIVGGGPAGHLAAAQLARFPGIEARLIDRATGPLQLGRADGVQARSVETFQAFGFAQRIVEEAYRITAMAFWRPDAHDASRLVRAGLPSDDPAGISEFPHLVVNQARIQAHFLECMARSPARMTPDYGVELLDLAVDEAEGGRSVEARVRHLIGTRRGTERTVRAKYVIGADGARSTVRRCIGRQLVGTQAMHAWGVMDVLAVTDFPDIRLKCAIQAADGGTLLTIPREGGYLVRMYVDLGEVDEGPRAERSTALEEVVERARSIIRPFSLDVRDVVWWSVYEVGHRLADGFDDARVEAGRPARVFIAGDACHTHSAKAGQGMNVSMQDAFNLAWKLGHVLEGRATEAVLGTYSRERRAVAQELIDFDRTWSGLMGSGAGASSAVEDFFVRTFEFTTGFMTQYEPSALTAAPVHQTRATGFPIGRRFRSAEVVRVCDANPVHLGHQARADGRWRLYVFADGDHSELATWADWARASDRSPIAQTPRGLDVDAWFDVRVVYQERFDAVELDRVPSLFLPRRQPFGLIDYEKVYAAGAGPDGTGADIFAQRGVDRGGAVVVVRPDQHVADVLPLSATDELADFFAALLPAGHQAAPA